MRFINGYGVDRYGKLPGRVGLKSDSLPICIMGNGSSVFGAGRIQVTKSRNISASWILTILFLICFPQLFKSDLLNSWSAPFCTLKILIPSTKEKCLSF